MKRLNQLLMLIALSAASTSCDKNSGPTEQSAPEMSAEQKAQVGEFKTLELYSSIPYCGNDNLSQAFYIIQYKAFFICKKNASFHYWQMLNFKGEKGEQGKDGGIDLGQTVLQADLSARHSCALLTNNSIFCWGDNSTGQIDNSKKAEIPAFQQSVGNTFVKGKMVAAGNGDTCAITMDDKVKCWGHSNLANGGSGINYNATSQIGNLHEVTDLKAGDGHFCAIGKGKVGNANSAKGLFCWGKNDKGQLGKPSSAIATSLEPVYTNIDATQIDLGYSITCGVERTSEAGFCFGTNASNEMGLGAGKRVDERPLTWVGDTELKGVKKKVRHIAVGKNFTCIGNDEYLYCAGANRNNLIYELDIDFVETYSPPSLRGLWGPPSDVIAGDSSFCYTQKNARSYSCVGKGVGVASTQKNRHVALGADNICEIIYDNTLQCNGDNALGKSALNAEFYRKEVTAPERLKFPRDPKTPNVLR